MLGRVTWTWLSFMSLLILVLPGKKPNCEHRLIACHSASLVTQNSGGRAHWLSLIRWMQETQGLWQLDESNENTILEYLSSYYGPKEGTRRSALRADQLPSNPYRPSKT